MTDEKFVFVQDVREKKHTARSAFNRRTHTGRRGTVKLPSDYLSRKELNAMNGEVKSYRLNDPMTWDEFKTMPDDIMITYIKAIREKFGASDTAIARMMGVPQQTFSRYVRVLGISTGQRAGKREWDKDGFYAWVNGTSAPKEQEAEASAKIEETCMVSFDEVADSKLYEEFPIAIPADEAAPVIEAVHAERAIPSHGTMTFNGSAKESLETIAWLLGDSSVRLTVTWAKED